MRLIHRKADGGFVSENLAESDTIPPYAILSHTWVKDEEVSFQDLAEGTGHKSGYNKLDFCAEQAERDGLRYFWVDTCCIDKSNHAEEQREINTMFRRYRDASRCYVYLSDVSSSNASPWEQDFRASRWFTRGWTLQELLAPKSVEFFSKERELLGDKGSLLQQIHEVTGIPQAALQGGRLTQFTVDERFLWAQRRQTTVAEDKIYSLLGIFDVEILLHYGNDGAEGAERRLREIINRREKCIHDLCISDPRRDKVRIQETKGGLLKDSYCWVLENPNFKQWRSAEQNTLLWVKGDPGKGKTMLLCGVLDELDTAEASTYLLAYFFCQATDPRINNATAVLRGLIYMLVCQQPSLVSHVQKQYEQIGKKAFEDANAWFTLREIFVNILHDSNLDEAFIVIDALDECLDDLPKLLSLIVEQPAATSRVKWIVSSRNWPQIESQLSEAQNQVKLSLELNDKSIEHAIDTYIGHKLAWLARHQSYTPEVKAVVLNHLSQNAENTFLWVALVCERLRTVSRRNVKGTLSEFPPGLNPLYMRMLEQINLSDDADLCKYLLAAMAVTYRPITLQELTSLGDILSNSLMDIQEIGEVVGLCGLFLTIRGDTIYFVHQSAKDFLATDATRSMLPASPTEIHHAIIIRSLHVLSNTLRRDIYNLQAPGFPIEQLPKLSRDPLAAVRYISIYWVDHMCDWLSGCQIECQNNCLGYVLDFLKQKCLYWFEAVSLCGGISEVVLSIARLCGLMQEKQATGALLPLLQDMHRFILYHKQAIENYPLQTYTSALIFSPQGSLIRRHSQHEDKQLIQIRPDAIDNWGACLQTLEGHSDSVRSVAVSGDSRWVVTGSYDHTAKIWDAGSGRCLQTLEGHSGFVRSVAVSDDSRWVVTGSWDHTAKIWDAGSGRCLQTLEGHSDSVRSVAVSGDSRWVVTGSWDHTAKIWDAGSGRCLQTLDVGKAVQHISFDVSGKFFKTEIGPMFFEVLSESLAAADTQISNDISGHGLGLSGNGKWITIASKEHVWLPTEYRPLCSAASAELLAVGAGSGRVWLCTTNI